MLSAIKLTKEYKAKVADFGLSREKNSDSANFTHSNVGPLRWMVILLIDLFDECRLLNLLTRENILSPLIVGLLVVLSVLLINVNRSDIV